MGGMRLALATGSGHRLYGSNTGRMSRASPARLAQRRASQHGYRRHLEQSDADPHLRWRGSREGNPCGEPIDLIVTESVLRTL